MCENDYFDPTRLELDEQEAQEALDASCMEFFYMLHITYCAEDRVC